MVRDSMVVGVECAIGRYVTEVNQLTDVGFEVLELEAFKVSFCQISPICYRSYGPEPPVIPAALHP